MHGCMESICDPGCRLSIILCCRGWSGGDPSGICSDVREKGEAEAGIWGQSVIFSGYPSNLCILLLSVPVIWNTFKSSGCAVSFLLVDVGTCNSRMWHYFYKGGRACRDTSTFYSDIV